MINAVCFYWEIPFQRVFIFIQNLFFNYPPPGLLPPRLVVNFAVLKN